AAVRRGPRPAWRPVTGRLQTAGTVFIPARERPALPEPPGPRPRHRGELGVTWSKGRSPGTTQRAQRNPKMTPEKGPSDGSKSERTAKTPASAPSRKLPPRNNAPGIWLKAPLPLPPKQLKSPPPIPVWVVQSVHPTLSRSAQSATHSCTFPTMSKTPQLDLQLDREPVFTAPLATEMSQSVVPLSVPGSGVPAAAPCHSRFVSSRFPESRHAWFAWNQVMHALGCTPGIDTA